MRCCSLPLPATINPAMWPTSLAMIFGPRDPLRPPVPQCWRSPVMLIAYDISLHLPLFVPQAYGVALHRSSLGQVMIGDKDRDIR